MNMFFSGTQCQRCLPGNKLGKFTVRVHIKQIKLNTITVNRNGKIFCKPELKPCRKDFDLEEFDKLKFPNIHRIGKGKNILMINSFSYSFKL